MVNFIHVLYKRSMSKLTGGVRLESLVRGGGGSKNRSLGKYRFTLALHSLRLKWKNDENLVLGRTLLLSSK